MLYDLTRIQGARIKDADDIMVTRHWYARTADVRLFAFGFLAALPAVGILQAWVGMIAIALMPISGLTAYLLFTRRRSTMGEISERRWDRLRDKAVNHEGLFILPGSEPFKPSDAHLIAVSDDPIVDAPDLQ